jgi:hypothetical protein
VPLRDRADQVIGVTQVLNKHLGTFTASDMALLEAISRHAASALEQAQMVGQLEQARREELELLAITEAISTELHLDTLLVRIVSTPSARRCSSTTRAKTSFGPELPKVPSKGRSAYQRMPDWPVRLSRAARC